MKTNTTALLTALVLGATALSTSAQDAPGRSSRRPGPEFNPGTPNRPERPNQAPPVGVPTLLKTLDANHDGVIDTTEISAAPAALRALDANGDGTVTLDELRPNGRGPGRPAGADAEGARPMRPPFIATLDTNENGKLEAAEIENAAAALKTLDKDADGMLTRDELRPEGRGSGHPGGPNGPRGRGERGFGPRGDRQAPAGE